MKHITVLFDVLQSIISKAFYSFHPGLSSEKKLYLLKTGSVPTKIASVSCYVIVIPVH